jgi:hypothetical protein
LIAVVVLGSGITERKSRVRKIKILASAIFLLVAVLFSLLVPVAQWGLPSAPRQQWQAATTPVGPAIDRVLIEGRQATIEGEATTDSQITIAVGGEGYERCGFPKNGRFTATVTAVIWGEALDIAVVDAEGDVLLRVGNVRFGSMQSQRGRIIFRTSPLKPEADGSFVIAEYQRQTGPPLPISVRLEKEKAAPVDPLPYPQ